MDTGLIIGLSLSIPLSILANILTPRVQRYWDERRVKVSFKRLKTLQKEYDEIKSYVEDRQKLTMASIRLLLLSVYLILTSILLFFCEFSLMPLTETDSTSDYYLKHFFIPAINIFCCFVIMALNFIINRHLNKYRKVKDFSNYESQIKNIFEKKGNGKLG